MLELRQFEPNHILALSPREPDKSIVDDLPDPVEYAKEYVKRGPCWTAFINDVPMVCGGVIILWPGVGEGWALTSELVKKFPVAFHRSVKIVLDQIAFEHKLRRLQVAIPHNHLVSRRWMIRLGYRKECAMPFYGPDTSTWIRYTRFFKWDS